MNIEQSLKLGDAIDSVVGVKTPARLCDLLGKEVLTYLRLEDAFDILHAPLGSELAEWKEWTLERMPDVVKAHDVEQSIIDALSAAGSELAA